jgi:hypothetical protein
MKLSDKILVIAKWLEADSNELLAEAGEEQLHNLALSFLHASETLKEAAEEIRESEPTESTTFEITPDKLEELAAVAASFDESGDEMLMRQASVLDEILHTLAAPKDYIFNFKKAEDDKIDELKKKYKDVREELHEDIGTREAVEAIKKSPFYQQEHRMAESLSTRYCPDHAGAPIARLANGDWQCSLDHKVYNFDTGFTNLKGEQIGGGSVSEQTPKYHPEGHMIFDSRDGRLGIHRE